MSKLISDYRGGGRISEEVAEIIKAEHLTIGLASYCEPWDAGMVDPWFHEGFEDRLLLAAVSDGGTTLGFAWAHPAEPCLIIPVPDPRIPAGLGLRVAEALACRALEWLLSKGCRGILEIHGGYQYGRRHLLLKRMLSSYIETRSGALTMLAGEPRGETPPGYVLREASPGKARPGGAGACEKRRISRSRLGESGGQRSGAILQGFYSRLGFKGLKHTVKLLTASCPPLRCAAIV